MSILFAILIFGGFLYWNSLRNPEPPTPLSEDELKAEGYTSKEARREARAMRAEVRASARSTRGTWKTANFVFRTAKKLTK